MGEITEMDLPGIGKKFSFATAVGGTVTVIIHLNGRRDLYYSLDDDEDPAMFTLTDEEARRLSAIVGDTFYKPTPMDALRSALTSDISIDIIAVSKGAEAVGRTIHELEVRKKTGVSVLAVQRGDDSIANPPPSTRIEAGDVLIVMGPRTGVRKLETIVKK